VGGGDEATSEGGGGEKTNGDHGLTLGEHLVQSYAVPTSLIAYQIRERGMSASNRRKTSPMLRAFFY
jgi:hypothetical protein